MFEPAAEGGLHPALVAALRDDRESLNQRFRLRQRAGAKIDAQAFQRHLRTTVNELVGMVAIAQAERARAVVNALFDASLDLFTAGLLGPTAKHPHVSAAWRDVLPQAVRLLARDPFRIAGCISNAVDCLAAHASGRPNEWIGLMGRMAPHCDGVPQFLEAGKVAAWKAGLVQYRTAALQRARHLPWKLGAILFDLPGDATENDWRRQLDRLEADRWHVPGSIAAEAAERRLSMVGTTGGFRGFGGPCLRPPTVVVQDHRLFVSDGERAWQLLADAFGTLWHRVPAFPVNGPLRESAPDVTLHASGRITWNNKHAQFDDLADASGYACDGQTLAVTLPTSHHVFLLAQAATGGH